MDTIVRMVAFTGILMTRIVMADNIVVIMEVIIIQGKDRDVYLLKIEEMIILMDVSVEVWKIDVNYDELLQLVRGWSDFISDYIIIW